MTTQNNSQPVLTPNGIYSFAETLHDITTQFADYLAKNPGCRPQDSRELVQTCIQWAELFERDNAGREWDGEYLEEIEAFFEKQIADCPKNA